MSPPAARCLTLEAFQQIADQSTDADDVRRWASHLAGCPGCITTTRALRAEAVVVQAVTDRLGPWEPLLAAVRAALGMADLTPSSATPLPPRSGVVDTYLTLDRVLSKQSASGAVVSPLERTRVEGAVRPPSGVVLTASHLARQELVIREKAAELSPQAPLTATTPLRGVNARPAPSTPPAGSAPPAPDGLGRIGSYRVLKQLGAGAVGVVYLAEDIHLKRMVALKLMKGEDVEDEMCRQRFLREGRSVAALEHENIVTVYQVGEADGVPFLAMQYLQGETLDERLKRDRQIPVVEVVRIAKEIAAGLAAAHDQGLIHRDIKPANIWLEAGKGRVKILDFGLARAATDDTHLTQTGMVVGTPAYMSPEQGRGARVDHRTDLYSLGCVIYAMCAGVPPFQAQDTMSMLVALATDSPRPLTAHNPNVPPPLVGLVNRLLVKHPDARLPSAHEALIVLETIERILPRLMHELTPQGWADPSAGRESGNGFVQVILWALLLTGVVTIGGYLLAPATFAQVIEQVKSVGRGR